MTGAEYLAFLAASAILALTPGPDTFLTLRFGAHDVRDGLVYTVAVALGIMAWAVLALTGVAAMLEQFPGIRTGLTWIGGSYLLFLGASAVYQLRRSRKAAAPSVVLVAAGTMPTDTLDEEPPAAVVNNTVNNSVNNMRKKASSVFRTGLISSLTNPKTGLFFLALMPPFLPHSPSLVDHCLLVATVAGCILVYGAFLSAVAGRVGGLLTSGSGPAIIDTAAGTVLVVLGITVLLMS